MFKQFLILVIFCWCVSCRDIPSFVHLCKRHDKQLGQCFVDSLYDLMPRLTSGGIPELDVPSIDPLSFSSIKVDTGNTGSVNLLVQLQQGTVTGLRKMKIRDHIMDLDKITSTVKFNLPEVNIDAAYTIKGKILLFELNGGGRASFNASDLTTDAYWSGKRYMQKGKEHLRLDNITFTNVNIGNLAVRLDDLFSDNQLLTDTVNNAINDNVDTLKDELEPLIEEVLAGIILKYFNRVYQIFSTDQLFL